jgi:hypothetical protein
MLQADAVRYLLLEAPCDSTKPVVFSSRVFRLQLKTLLIWNS